MDIDKLGDEIAQRVGEAMADVEVRAREIIADAEREAAEIRRRAESEARDRLAEVRGALDRLESSITGERAAVVAEAKADLDTKVEVEPAPEPDDQETVAIEASEAAEDDLDVEKADEDLPEAEVTGDGEIDEAGARLVAMEMALDGEDVEAIATRLTEEFGLVDAQEVASEVHNRTAP